MQLQTLFINQFANVVIYKRDGIRLVSEQFVPERFPGQIERTRPNCSYILERILRDTAVAKSEKRKERDAKGRSKIWNATERHIGGRPEGETAESFGSRSTWKGNGRAESNEGMSREQFKQFRLI